MPKPLSESLLTGDILHEWTIKEYNQYQRGKLWYVLTIGIGSFLVVYGFLSNNFLFSLIIILAGVILFIQSRQEPAQVLFQVAELGIVVGSRFYNYSELESFYIIYKPPEVKTLYIKTSSPIRPLFNIPLLDQDPIEVRNNLLDFLDEDFEKEDELNSDTLARGWKMH